MGVVLGAFGAHAIKDRITPEMLTIFQTGVHYHQLHGVALLGVAASVPLIGENKAKWVSRLFQIGIIIFGGSLYVLALTGTRTYGAITPFGGLAFILGWFILMFGAVKGSGHASEPK